MIQPICHNPMLLACKSSPASESDLNIARDLQDTLFSHREECVGMAANMIGQPKAIIAICIGPTIQIMLNPKIISHSAPYETEEGCLSLPGVRKATRYRTITVTYQDMQMMPHTVQYHDFTAQIIQHEVDHLNGILI